MRIAISGTHFIGKSTLSEDFIKKYPTYKYEIEPYYQLQEESVFELSLEPTVESLLEQLDHSINQLHKCKNEKNVIFDRCPIDFLAYAMCALDEDSTDINQSEFAERFSEIKEALKHLDLIVFLPIDRENSIEYTEENPAYRRAVDKNFKKLYWDETLDIFPKYGSPRIIEIAGDRTTRIKILESYLL